MGSLDSTISEFQSSNVAEFKPIDPVLFSKQAHQTVDFIADYYKTIESHPVLTQVQPGYLHSRLPDSAPNRPESFDTILHDVQNDIMPGLTHWMSPNFFAYFSATGSTAAFLGEMLCSAFNTDGFNWLASPAATELEMVVMDWLAQMLKLPKSLMFSGTGGGVILGNTTEAILVTLVAAKDQALAAIGIENVGKLVVYCSDETHSSFVKACKLAGIFPSNVRAIPTTLDTCFSLPPAVLRDTVEADVAAGLVPLYVCATVGTTSTTAVDSIEKIADVANDYSMWLHVDAAYAGSACICPEFRHYLNGVERANSLSLNAHKWLFTYLDCCCLWVKKPTLLVNSLSQYPEYLKNKASETESVVDYKDWQVGTHRRFRALRLWFVLRIHGVVNLQGRIRYHISLAKTFEELVKSDPRFEIVVPRNFGLICFRLNPVSIGGPGYTEVLNRKLLDWINGTGRIYMTHTIVGKIYMLRLAVGGTFTEERHVLGAWRVIKEGADALLKDKEDPIKEVQVQGY